MGRLIPFVFILILCAAPAIAASPADGPEEASSPLLEDPLDLNSASVEELMLIPSVSRRDAELIVSFRSRNGAFSSVGELFGIEGLDPAKVSDVIPYVRIDGRGSFDSLSGRLRTRISGDPRGRTPRPYRASLRLGVESGERIRLGLLTDKDAGERSFSDFVAAYIDISGVPFVDRVVLGHYRPGFPIGLLFSRSSWVLSPPRPPRPARRSTVGYSLSDENGPLFGLFVERRFGSLKASVFASSSRRDATLDSLGTVVALREGGLHVTGAEISGRDALSEKTVGANLSWEPSRGAFLSVTFCSAAFSRRLRLRYGRGGYTRFSGRNLSSLGLGFGASAPHLSLFGEVASGSGGSFGAVLGAELDYGRVNVYILARAYGPGLLSPYGVGYSAYGDAENEIGLLFETELRSRAGAISLSLDQYGRLQGRGPSDFPARGSRLSAELRRRVSEGLWASMRLRLTSRSDSFWGGEGDRGELRSEWTWRGSRLSCLRWRTERIWARAGDGGTEYGVLTFGELRAGAGGRLTLGGRITYFDADSYLSRVYEAGGTLAAIPFRAWSGRGTHLCVFSIVELGPASLALRLDRALRENRDDLEIIFQTDAEL